MRSESGEEEAEAGMDLTMWVFSSFVQSVWSSVSLNQTLKASTLVLQQTWVCLTRWAAGQLILRGLTPGPLHMFLLQGSELFPLVFSWLIHIHTSDCNTTSLPPGCPPVSWLGQTPFISFFHQVKVLIMTAVLHFFPLHLFFVIIWFYLSLSTHCKLLESKDHVWSLAQLEHCLVCGRCLLGYWLKEGSCWMNLLTVVLSWPLWSWIRMFFSCMAS